MRIEPDLKYDYPDVLIRPRKNTLASRAEVQLTRSFTFTHGGKWAGFPLIAANMDTIGTIPMAKALAEEEALVSLQKFYPSEQLVPFFQTAFSRNSFYTLGIADADLSKLSAVQSAVALPKISIDVANGYIQKFVDVVRNVRRQNPGAIIMAGTVVTGEMAKDVVAAGADIVRIGIGSGSACKTRDVTGVGVPQLSAVADCADVVHRIGAYVCADGGCKSSGDIAKAFGAGADFVMLGGMLAGHDECESVWKYEDCEGKRLRKSMMFYGMASDTAMLKRYGVIAPHRTAEGITVEVPYRGPVRATLRQIKAGLRSMMTYVGAESLDEIPNKTTFVRASAQHT